MIRVVRHVICLVSIIFCCSSCMTTGIANFESAAMMPETEFRRVCGGYEIPKGFALQGRADNLHRTYSGSLDSIHDEDKLVWIIEGFSEGCAITFTAGRPTDFRSIPSDKHSVGELLYFSKENRSRLLDEVCNTNLLLLKPIPLSNGTIYRLYPKDFEPSERPLSEEQAKAWNDCKSAETSNAIFLTLSLSPPPSEPSSKSPRVLEVYAFGGDLIYFGEQIAQ